jgi:hypothetical protein
MSSVLWLLLLSSFSNEYSLPLDIA